MGDCHRVGQTDREWGGGTVIEAGRLSESWGDCQRVGQTVIESGRLSESRGGCHRVGQTVRESGSLNLCACCPCVCL